MTNKTLKLFERYLKLFNEQEPGSPEDATGSTAQPPTPQEQSPAEVPEENVDIDENEKYVIKILTNAFIFNPLLFDKNKQNYIKNKIDQIKKTVNVPVAKIIDEVKRIISLDSSLRVESKTLSVIRNLYMFLEQPADATEPQADQPATTTDQPKPVSDGAEFNKLNLTEIFPLYKELILKALSHIPTEEELMILKPVVNEFADTDPEKIVDTIQNILSQSLEDKEVQDTLSNA